MNSRIVGALWKREKDGNEYFSGVLKDLHGDINIAVFPNTYKQAENQPDFNIVISFGKKEEEPVTEAPPKKNGRKKPREEEAPPF